MIRKALIITYPGPKNTQRYCAGVNKDRINYSNFLKSSLGGAWREDEIAVLNRPSVAILDAQLSEMRRADYGLFIFSGHGGFDDQDDTTLIELNDQGESYDGLALSDGLEKSTTILDCCRVQVPLLEERKVMFNAAAARISLNKEDCRKYYDKEIEKCGEAQIVCYSCAIGEKSGDDSQRGGIYSHRLLGYAHAWYEEMRGDVSDGYWTQSIVAAHENATVRVKQRTRNRQNPQIYKPRSDPYFPFVIIA